MGEGGYQLDFVGWSGVEWSGMGWNGVEWGGVEWGGVGGLGWEYTSGLLGVRPPVAFSPCPSWRQVKLSTGAPPWV